MTLLVNGETVPQELITQEAGRLDRLPMFSPIADERERERRVRAVAESAVLDRVILRQIARRMNGPSIQKKSKRASSFSGGGRSAERA